MARSAPGGVSRRAAPDRPLRLCPTHHAQVTREWLTNDEVHQKDQARERDTSVEGASHLLHIKAPFLLGVGPMIMMDAGASLKILDTPIFSIDEDATGRVSISANLFDQRGSSMMRIKNNVITYMPRNWDVEMVGPTVRIRTARNRVAMELHVSAPHTVYVRRLNLFHSDWDVDAKPGRLLFKTRSGGGGIDTTDVVHLTRGTMSLPEHGMRLSEVHSVSYPGDRLDAFATRGMLPAAIKELVHGMVVLVVQHPTGWEVRSKRLRLPPTTHGDFKTLGGATGRAQRIARADSYGGRVITIPRRGSGSTWFANSLDFSEEESERG